MNEGDNLRYIDELWDNSILASLADYIKIPAKSPLFDKDWAANGYLEEAVELMLAWVRKQDVPGLSIDVHRLPERTPTILMSIDGDSDDTVLIYGHLDKQPEFNGWEEGLEGLRAGSKIQLIIPAKLAYGKAGVPSMGIPEDAELIFKVEVLKVT